MTLVERLEECANVWARLSGRSLARLATIVMNDGKFFARLGQPNATTSAATLERFARYLGDSSNWPDGTVPSEVIAFLQVTGVAQSSQAEA